MKRSLLGPGGTAVDAYSMEYDCCRCKCTFNIYWAPTGQIVYLDEKFQSSKFYIRR